jgi:hypothetical protein
MVVSLFAWGPNYRGLIAMQYHFEPNYSTVGLIVVGLTAGLLNLDLTTPDPFVLALVFRIFFPVGFIDESSLLSVP